MMYAEYPKSMEDEDLQEFFEGDYHDNKELMDYEIDLWIQACRELNRKNLMSELVRVKNEGL